MLEDTRLGPGRFVNNPMSPLNAQEVYKAYIDEAHDVDYTAMSKWLCRRVWCGTWYKPWTWFRRKYFWQTDIKGCRVYSWPADSKTCKSMHDFYTEHLSKPWCVPSKDNGED